MSRFTHVTDSNRFIRVMGRDRPAAYVLDRAVKRRGVPVMLRSSDPGTAPHIAEGTVDEGTVGAARVDTSIIDASIIDAETEDYTLLDPALEIASQTDDPLQGDVRSGTGYAGMTPVQRAAYLAWLIDPSRIAPPAFQELYLATHEVRLFEGGAIGDDAHLSLRSMQLEPAWRGSRALERTIVLGFWLQQDGSGLAQWLTTAPVPADLLATGLGMQALLATPLTVGELAKIGAVWDQPALDVPEAMLKMRLASLTTNLGAEPLVVALDRLEEEARQPLPWRCAHRDLRISLPQPRMRTVLEPVLAEMATIRSPKATAVAQMPEAAALLPDPDEAPAAYSNDDYLILEFGQSRSEYFDYVLQLTQRQNGFTQLMDEDRHLIYRVQFRKDKLRNFWRIWEYVQKWSACKVYVNGEEIEHWKIWPYSQYLR